MSVSIFFDIHEILEFMALASARIMPTFILMPFLNSSVLSNSIRTPVAMLIGMVLWPHSPGDIPDLDKLGLLILIFKESMIGLFLAVLFSMPFWIMHGVGAIIDNQRGATLGSNLNPVSGMDTSELANFLHLFSTAVFLQLGGILLIIESIHQSYSLSDPLTLELPLLSPSVSFISELMLRSLILSSPVITAFLISEIFLGLISRYAPQMNAFSLSLAVKSVLGFFILILYFSPYIPNEIKMSFFQPYLLKDWF